MDLSWIFESIVNWVASIVTSIMDAVSGIFLDALGTDMTAMEQYFPFVTEAFSIFQYSAWALLFLITVWQLFRVFGGPVTEAENPWQLLVRSAIFALLIGYANPSSYWRWTLPGRPTPPSWMLRWIREVLPSQAWSK